MAKPYTFQMKCKHLAIRCIMRCFGLLPIVENKIVFTSYFGKGYGDNGKALTEALLARDPGLDIVWCVRPAYMSSLPAGVRGVAYNSLAYLKELSTAAAWVDNSRKNPGIVKRKKQFYMQTWHGTVALKRIEKDAQNNLDEFYVAGAKNDSKLADVILSGCRFFTELCRRAFWYDGEILECGSPRSDALFATDSEKQAEIKKSLGLSEDTGMVLYAPTFRADGSLDCYRMDFEGVLNALEAQTGRKWVLLVRLHPNIAEKADFISYSQRIINATVFQDLYTLIPTVDMVITDYSSVMFDASLIGKPVFLFATDTASYMQDRNFYFDLEELPFPLANSNEALLKNIVDFDPVQYEEKAHAFNSFLGYFEDGTAAKTAAERILTEINGKAK